MTTPNGDATSRTTSRASLRRRCAARRRPTPAACMKRAHFVSTALLLVALAALLQKTSLWVEAAVHPDGTCNILSLLPFSVRQMNDQEKNRSDPVHDKYRPWTNGTTQKLGLDATAAALLAIHHFNNKTETVVKDLKNLTMGCNITLSLSVEDSQWDNGDRSVRQTIEAVGAAGRRQPRPNERREINECQAPTHNARRDLARGSGSQFPCVVLSPISEKAAMAVSTTTSALGVPQVVWHTSGEKLLSVESPTTVGVGLSLSGKTQAMVEYLQNTMQPPRDYLVVITEPGPRTSDLAEALERLGQAVGLTVLNFDLERPPSVYEMSSSTSTAAEALKQSRDKLLDSVKQTGITTIMLNVEDAAIVSSLASLLDGKDMFRPEYVYILLSEAFPTDHLTKVVGEQVEGSPLDLLLSGSIVFDQLDGFRSSTSSDPFLNAWKELGPEFVAELNALIPNTTDFRAGDSYFRKHLPSAYAAFVYDAVMTIGLGGCHQEMPLDGMEPPPPEDEGMAGEGGGDQGNLPPPSGQEGGQMNFTHGGDPGGNFTFPPGGSSGDGTLVGGFPPSNYSTPPGNFTPPPGNFSNEQGSGEQPAQPGASTDGSQPPPSDGSGGQTGQYPPPTDGSNGGSSGSGAGVSQSPPSDGSDAQTGQQPPPSDNTSGDIGGGSGSDGQTGQQPPPSDGSSGGGGQGSQDPPSDGQAGQQPPPTDGSNGGGSDGQPNQQPPPTDGASGGMTRSPSTAEGRSPPSSAPTEGPTAGIGIETTQPTLAGTPLQSRPPRLNESDTGGGQSGSGERTLKNRRTQGTPNADENFGRAPEEGPGRGGMNRLIGLDPLVLAMTEVRFHGASGLVHFAGGAKVRDPSGALAGLYNIQRLRNLTRRLQPATDGAPMNTFKAELVSAWGVGSMWLPHNGTSTLYRDGSNATPTLTRKVANQNYLSTTVRAVGLTLLAVAWALGFGSIAAVHVLRKDSIVQRSQPFFLQLLCFGSVIMSSSILTLSFDEGLGTSQEGLDVACMATQWFFFIGQMMVFSALFTKLWRLDKVLQFRRGTKVTILKVIAPLVVLLVMTVVILSVWSAVDPWSWNRVIISLSPAESYGQCGCSNFWAYFGPLMALVLAAEVVTGFFAWKTADVPEDFRDSSAVFYSILTQLQAWLVGVPILAVLGTSSADATYFGRVLLIWIFAVSSIGIVVAPKVVRAIHIRRHPELANRGSRVKVSGVFAPPSLPSTTHTGSVSFPVEDRNSIPPEQAPPIV